MGARVNEKPIIMCADASAADRLFADNTVLGICTLLTLMSPRLLNWNGFQAGDLPKPIGFIRCVQTTPILARGLSGNNYSANIRRPI
jgi:hypothetical protein